MAKFGRKVIRSGSKVQIWNRIAGGNWTLTMDFDDFHEQYGPYAGW